MHGDSSSQWTFWRSTLAVFLAIDLCLIVFLAFRFTSAYDKITEIIKGLLVSVIPAIMSFFVIKKPQEKTFIEFLRLQPIQLIIPLYTLFLVFITIWIGFPFRKLNVITLVGDEPQKNVKIFVNDKKDPIATMEKNGVHTISNMDIGDYNLKVALDGFKDESRIVTVGWLKGASNIVKINLEPIKTGSLKFTLNIIPVDIFIKNQEIKFVRKEIVNTTPYIISKLPIGTYDISISKTGCDTIYAQVTLKDDETTDVMGELCPELQTGNLTVITNLSQGVHISIKSEKHETTKVNTTTETTFQNIPIGSYDVKVYKNGYHDISLKRVEVKPNDTQEIKFALKKLANTGNLKITCNKTNANIYINGKRQEEKTIQGIPVIINNLPVGTVQLKIEMIDNEGWAWREENPIRLKIEQGQTKVLDNITLVRSQVKPIEVIIFSSNGAGAKIFLKGESVPRGYISQNGKGKIKLPPGTYDFQLRKGINEYSERHHISLNRTRITIEFPE